MGRHDAPATPVGLSGSDVAATIKAFEKLKPKDEFEMTAIYKARPAK
jgi:hypothetical protein